MWLPKYDNGLHPIVAAVIHAPATAYSQDFSPKKKIYLIRLVKHNVKRQIFAYARSLEAKKPTAQFLLMKPMEDLDSSSLQPNEKYSPSYLRSQWSGSRIDSLSYLSA